MAGMTSRHSLLALAVGAALAGCAVTPSIERWARAYDLARRGHAAGALNTIDLIDAERNWYQARLQQVGAYRDQLVGQVAAFKALGGGYVTTGSLL